jgi:hypothetical protein
VHFASFLSGGFITAIVVNPPESKVAKRTSVHCLPGQNGKFSISGLKMMVKSFLNYSIRKLFSIK